MNPEKQSRGNARSRNNPDIRLPALQEAMNQAYGIGKGQDKNCNKEVIRLHQAFCDYCSTIEGESELSRNSGRIIYQPTTHPIYNHTSYLYLHTGAVMRDLAVEQYLTRKELCSSNHLRTPHATPLEPTQNAATNYDHHCTVSDCSFTKC